jgi:Tfp pilus assembly protein PilV
MDSGNRTLLRVVALLVVVIGIASLASAQLNSAAQPIALNAQLAESLTLSLTANAVNFTLTAGSGSNAGSTNITATTAWILKPGRTQVTVDAFFATAAAALTDGGTPANNIPSSAFFISDNGGAAAALVNNVAFGGANAGLRLATVAITGANKNSSRTDNMAFNINLTGGTLPQLPAGTYTGTLNIQAQATP